MATMTKAALKTELQTDPQTLGYAALVAANNDVALAALLNDKTKGGSIPRTLGTASDLQSCVDSAEYAALTGPKQGLWTAMLIAAIGNGVPLANAGFQAQAVYIWPAAGPTLTALTALLTRAGSRAEALWGDGTSVSFSQVSDALRN